MVPKTEVKQVNKNSKNRLVRCLQSIFRNWDVKIMVYVMLIVVSVALIAGTVAWFTYFKMISAKNLEFATGDCNSIKVAIQSGGADIQELQQVPGNPDSIVIDLNTPLYNFVESYYVEEAVIKEPTTEEENSGKDADELSTEQTVTQVVKKEKSKLAPGVYGELKLYITSLNKEINHFRITPTTLLTYSDGSYDEIDDSEWAFSWNTSQQAGNKNVITLQQVKELRQLVQGHILFFSNRVEGEEDGQKTVTYSGQIFQEKNGELNIGPLEGALEFDSNAHEGVEKLVTIYWYWPYEYGDIPSETQARIRYVDDESVSGFAPEMFFDLEEGGSLPTVEDSSRGTRLTQLYDYADTKIGTYVQSIRIHLKVDGYHKSVEE